MEEYIRQHEERNLKVLHGTYSEAKFACPECKVGGMCKRLDVVLTTYPVQYSYVCNECGHIEHLPY
jgi:predicted nucleic acid-binding Zn ribbon protein